MSVFCEGARRMMENLFVTKDWFEVFLAQNLVFDGLIYPLIHRHYEQSMDARAGQALAMLTSFISDWYDETSRWVDATLKTAVDESAANAKQIATWYVAPLTVAKLPRLVRSPPPTSSLAATGLSALTVPPV